jgi:5-methylthioribose kinase
VTSLTGGVSSDIYKIESGGRVFAMKRALPQLRVAQLWEAPVSRNASEVDWMLHAASVVPGAVPQILAHDPDLGVFAMSYLAPESHPVWKTALLAGFADPAFAAQVGASIAAIQAATAFSPEAAARFANGRVFHAIRLEPYLEATARVHPDLQDTLLALSRRTLSQKIALVHGDVSPKNILQGPHGPVFLDAECAWFGDPAFDAAFCLNHLLLKCLHRKDAARRFLACFDALAEAYLAAAGWEDRANLEARIACLLPALFLARVDGKSPVEYLSDPEDKARVRRVARPSIANPPQQLAPFRDAWAMELGA